MEYERTDWIIDMLDKYAECKYKEELEWLYSEIKSHQEYTAELEDKLALYESLGETTDHPEEL